MSRLYEVSGTYGSGETPCTVFVYEQYNGNKWYCVEDSVNVNCTYEDIDDGVNVELLQDIDCMTTQEPVLSLYELEEHIDGKDDNDLYTVEDMLESWINGQRKQMVGQLQESPYESSEFIELLDCDLETKLKIAIYLLES